MEHLSEVAKILEHALAGNQKAVRAYAELLVEKLNLDGETRQAQIIARKLSSEPLQPDEVIIPLENIPGDKVPTGTCPQCGNAMTAGIAIANQGNGSACFPGEALQTASTLKLVPCSKCSHCGYSNTDTRRN